MTVLTVKAQDTATAMEEIVEKLGKDSFIIGTKKIGNEILVKATNSPKKTLHSKQNINKKFNRMISKELNQSSSPRPFELVTDINAATGAPHRHLQPLHPDGGLG